MNKFSRFSMAAAITASLAAPAWAAPATFQDIQSTIDAGHLTQADHQIAQVLAAHPDSAQAHYVDARLLAAEGKWPLAQTELERAKQLDPGMEFVPADILAAFTRQVENKVQAGPVQSSSGGLIFLAIGFLLISAYTFFGIIRAQWRGSRGVPAGASRSASEPPAEDSQRPGAT